MIAIGRQKASLYQEGFRNYKHFMAATFISLILIQILFRKLDYFLFKIRIVSMEAKYQPIIKEEASHFAFAISIYFLLSL